MDNSHRYWSLRLFRLRTSNEENCAIALCYPVLIRLTLDHVPSFTMTTLLCLVFPLPWCHHHHHNHRNTVCIRCLLDCDAVWIVCCLFPLSFIFSSFVANNIPAGNSLLIHCVTAGFLVCHLSALGAKQWTTGAAGKHKWHWLNINQVIKDLLSIISVYPRGHFRSFVRWFRVLSNCLSETSLCFAQRLTDRTI